MSILKFTCAPGWTGVSLLSAPCQSCGSQLLSWQQLHVEGTIYLKCWAPHNLSWTVASIEVRSPWHQTNDLQRKASGSCHACQFNHFDIGHLHGFRLKEIWFLRKRNSENNSSNLNLNMWLDKTRSTFAWIMTLFSDRDRFIKGRRKEETLKTYFGQTNRVFYFKNTIKNNTTSNSSLLIAFILTNDHFLGEGQPPTVLA